MSNKPHIVKFSGGRSSGMMLLQILEEGVLDPKRGDVIVFNNTSTEHSATYSFTRKMKKIAEEEYNIPFLWTEFQTYEDSNNSRFWVRNSSYKLVNEKPYSEDNPNGYRSNGEVFEELISMNGFVPNMMTRSCTASMKIFVTNSFLSDWFACKDGIERLGHFGKSSRMKDQDIIEMHRKSGGGVPDEILLSKREFVRKQPAFRPEQKWSDYTNVEINIENPVLQESLFGDQAELYGDYCVEYVSCLGIRSDEKRRIVKILDRIERAQEETGRSLSNQPQGENIFAPLIDKGIEQDDVNKFWDEQDFDLDLPKNGLFSNCVFCPLKGKAKLLTIAKKLKDNQDKNSPESIDWWIDVEKKYSRDLNAENREKTSEKDVNYIGFFGGVKSYIFEEIKKNADVVDLEKIDGDLLSIDSVPCNCTD